MPTSVAASRYFI